MINKLNRTFPFLRIIGVFLLLTGQSFAQNSNPEAADEVFNLSPFTVDASDDQGYRATNTLAGSRLNTNLKDVSAAISVVTLEFIEDVGAVDRPCSKSRWLSVKCA